MLPLNETKFPIRIMNGGSLFMKRATIHIDSIIKGDLTRYMIVTTNHDVCQAFGDTCLSKLIQSLYRWFGMYSTFFREPLH